MKLNFYPFEKDTARYVASAIYLIFQSLIYEQNLSVY